MATPKRAAIAMTTAKVDKRTDVTRTLSTGVDVGLPPAAPALPVLLSDTLRSNSSLLANTSFSETKRGHAQRRLAADGWLSPAMVGRTCDAAAELQAGFLGLESVLVPLATPVVEARTLLFEGVVVPLGQTVPAAARVGKLRAAH